MSDGYAGSHFTGAVFVFDYKTGKSLGTLPPPPEGWDEPQGACNDEKGDVYIVNTSVSTVDKYTHGGRYLKTISVPGQYPANCAYDRSTDTLAIGSLISESGGLGNITFYRDKRLSKPFYPPNISAVFYLGYEGARGRLWLDGDGNSGFAYASFAKGVFKPVKIQGATIAFPGAVIWSAKTRTMVVGDQATYSGPTFYQVNDAGTVIGTTVTQCSQPSDYCDIPQAAIKGSGLVGPDINALATQRFAYPAGGAPERNYSAEFVGPIGVAISPDTP